MALSYEELVERFRKKVAMIPQECHTAIYYWLQARRVQEVRIAAENRIRQTVAVTKKVFWADGIPDEIAAAQTDDPKQLKMLKSLEDTMCRRAGKAFQQTRWYNEVALPAAEGVGLGPMLAGYLLWTIGSAKRFKTFGKIVRYAGLDVTPEGQAPKRAKGQRVSWNPELRTTLYKLTEVWNKMPDCMWRARWDAWKAWYAENRPEILEEKTKDGKPCGQGHIHNMARRKVQREFLRNLYTLWLEYEESLNAADFTH